MEANVKKFFAQWARAEKAFRNKEYYKAFFLANTAYDIPHGETACASRHHLLMIGKLLLAAGITRRGAGRYSLEQECEIAEISSHADQMALILREHSDRGYRIGE